MIAQYDVTLLRKEPELHELENPEIAVVDVGGRHEPELMNFDHHQFPADSPPICALSLVLQHLGIYEDAQLFCDWLEPTEWFDTKGPVKTCEWLDISRETLGKLQSTIDVSILRRFATYFKVEKGTFMHELMAMIGGDLLHYLRSTHKKLETLANFMEFWELEQSGETFYAAFLPKLENDVDDPGGGMMRYIKSLGREHEVAAMIYPDRRGSGYGLSRCNDHPKLDFTRIETFEDVHFAHPRGFVAKTTATEIIRLKELVTTSWIV